MNPEELDPYFNTETVDPPEPAPAFDESTLTEEQRHQIALKYAMESGQFIPRSMLPTDRTPEPTPAAPADDWDPLPDESVKDYTKRMLARERASWQQEVLSQSDNRYGAGATHAAAEMLTRTVEGTGNIPEAAKPFLRKIIPDLLKQNPNLANGIDELGIAQLRRLAIGEAVEAGAYQVGTPATQREDFIPTPRGTDLAPGIGQDTYEAAIRMWQELRDYPKDEKGSLLRPNPNELRELGVIR